MESLLVKDWIQLGKQLGKAGQAGEEAGGKKKKNKKRKNKGNKASKLWKAYLHRGFLSTNYEDLDVSRD